MSPMLRSVEEAGLSGLLRKRQPQRISTADFFEDAERLRALFARLINARAADEVALIPSASYGMAIVAKNLPTRAGQKIIMADAQFPSNVYPWMKLAGERGLDLEFVAMPVGKELRAKNWNERILHAIDDRTALVALGHVHWANGTRFDLEQIADKTHRHGGLIVADGTQSVGALPLDVQAFGLDALICAGYKWLMGPYSTGYAWLGPAFIEGQPLEENWVNRRNSEDFAQLVNYQPDYQPGARRFDVGERSNFIAVPMCIAALEQILAWGPGNIQAYCHALIAPYLPKWTALGYHTEHPDWRAAHLFGIELPPQVKPADVQQKLKEAGISVSVRGDFVRISPHVYNDAADMEALTEALSF